MKKHRILAFASAAAISACGSLAWAQGWGEGDAVVDPDDPPPAAARPNRPPVVIPEYAKVEVSDDIDERFLTPQQRKELQIIKNMPSSPPPEKKWRVVPRPGDENLPPYMQRPMIIEDTRGEIPDYQSGFGKVPDPNAAPALAPLDKDMIRIPQQAQTGTTMFENHGGQEFFGGIKDLKGVHIDPRLMTQPVEPSKGPAWAKDKIQKRQFVEGQQHYGNEDPGGFF